MGRIGPGAEFPDVLPKSMNAVFEPGWTLWSSPALSVGGQYFMARTKMMGPHRVVCADY